MLKRIGCTVLLLSFLLVLPVSAKSVDELYQEQLEASGGQELWEALPEETKNLLDDLQITGLKPEEFIRGNPQTVVQQLLLLTAHAASGPIGGCAVILIVVMLYAWIGGIRHTLRDEPMSEIFGIVCSLSVCGTLIGPLTTVITQTDESLSGISIFMSSFVPTYAAILLTGGHAASALSFQTVVLFAAEVMTALSRQFITPLMTVSLALGLIGSITPGIRLGNIGKAIGKCATWVLSLGMLLFAGMLSIQNLAGGAVDTLGSRALRFSLSSLVPVVGGSVSEAFGTIRSCISLLKSTVGCFGILATALLVLPSLLRCLLWDIGLTVCLSAADLFELGSISSLLQSVKSVLKCLVALLVSGAMFCIIAITVVTMATGGST